MPDFIFQKGRLDSINQAKIFILLNSLAQELTTIAISQNHQESMQLFFAH
jgi:hypothetical protein